MQYVYGAFFVIGLLVFGASDNKSDQQSQPAYVEQVAPTIQPEKNEKKPDIIITSTKT
jgi:hypothetical protein